MNWQLLGPLLITTAVATCGWFVVHALSSRRDRINKQREQRIGFLIEAYRRLESCAQTKTYDKSKLESAVADIQLFGTRRQIELVQKSLDEFATARTTQLDELLKELRQNLRTELRLEAAPDRILHLRFYDGRDAKDQKGRDERTI